MDPSLLEAFGLDPDVLHLNHGAYGVAPVVVRQAAAAWRERAERNPHRFNRVELGALVAEARERAAGFLGVEASRAAWVRNVSEGTSAVLGSLDLRPGDELVTSNHGYGAVRLALRHHAARSGARIIEAAFPVGAPDEEIVAAYAGASSPRTRLVVVDRITSPTATVVPVAAVAAGSFRVVYQNTGNVLAGYNSSGSTFTTGYGMIGGTSPSVTAEPDGSYAAAFEANNDHLYTVQINSSISDTATDLGMDNGTSPAIAY